MICTVQSEAYFATHLLISQDRFIEVSLSCYNYDFRGQFPAQISMLPKFLCL